MKSAQAPLYIWQHATWPACYYDMQLLAAPLAEARQQLGVLAGAAQAIGLARSDLQALRQDILVQEAIATAAILRPSLVVGPEDQFLNRFAAMARSALEDELRQGLAHEEFLLHYHIQVGSGGHITGAEALVRWNHPAQGMVPPGQFIPVAEDTGVILPLGQ